MRILELLRLKIFSWSRRFRTLAVLGLILSLLLSFGLLPVFSQQPVELSFLIGAQEVSVWSPVIEAFEEEHPDIRINIVEGPFASNLIEDLYTSSFLLGDSPYDFVYMDIVWVPKFAAAGWLEDLSDRVDPGELQDFLEGDINGGRYEDGLYRMPVRTDAGMLYYRQDLLDAIGAQPPETFEQLEQTAAAVQAATDTRWGYVWQGKQYEGLAAMFVEILGGHGGYWVNPETLEVGLDEPAAIEAVQFLNNLVAEGISPSGVTTYQEEESRRLFQNGESVFLRNWPYVWPLANAEDSEIRNKIGIKPMVHAPGLSSAACLGGWGWGISSSSPHVDEAWEAVQFLSGVEAQKQLVLAGGYLPTRRSLYSDPEILAAYPYFDEMLEVLESSELRPPIAQYAQASDILQRYLSAAIAGRMSPEDAMQSAASETRQLLNRA